MIPDRRATRASRGGLLSRRMPSYPHAKPCCGGCSDCCVARVASRRHYWSRTSHWRPLHRPAHSVSARGVRASLPPAARQRSESALRGRPTAEPGRGRMQCQCPLSDFQTKPSQKMTYRWTTIRMALSADCDGDDSDDHKHQDGAAHSNQSAIIRSACRVPSPRLVGSMTHIHLFSANHSLASELPPAMTVTLLLFVLVESRSASDFASESASASASASAVPLKL